MRNLEHEAIAFIGGLNNRTMIAHKNLILAIHLIRKPPTDMLRFLSMR
jgi:hypothetical protein